MYLLLLTAPNREKEMKRFSFEHLVSRLHVFFFLFANQSDLPQFCPVETGRRRIVTRCLLSVPPENYQQGSLTHQGNQMHKSPIVTVSEVRNQQNLGFQLATCTVPTFQRLFFRQGFFPTTLRILINSLE